MMLQSNFFRSKLARRIFLLFICCALIPITALAVFSYFHVTSNISDQSVRRLGQMTKASAMSIYEKLLFLEAELALIRAQWSQRLDSRDAAGSASKVLNKSTGRFKALAFVDGSHQVPLLNVIEDPPLFTLDNVQPLEQNKTIIKTVMTPAKPARIFLALAIKEAPRSGTFLVGEIESAYLWGIGHQNTLPPSTDLCVLNHDGSLLISSLDVPSHYLQDLVARTAQKSKRHFNWTYNGESYLASYNDLFLEAGFSAASWTIILTQPRALVFQAMSGFNIVFPLVLLLSILIVLLLSMVFIRKRTGPLGKLKQATEAVAAGDFSQEVVIDSGDEFESLAASFNTMTHQLQKQFNRLGLIAQIGRTTVGVLAADRLIQTVADAMAARLDFDCGALLLAAGGQRQPVFTSGYGFSRKALAAMAGLLENQGALASDELLTRLLRAREPIQIDVASDAQRASLFASAPSLAGLELHTLLAVPVIYERQARGILLVANTQPAKRITDSDRQLLTGISAQVAACFANLTAYQELQVSEARFRKAFDHAAAGMAIISLQKHFLKTNPYLHHMLGYSQEELRRISLLKIAHPEDARAIAEALDAMLSGRTLFDISEKMFLHKNGELVCGLVSTSLLTNSEGQPLHFIAQIQDISKQKRAEKESREFEAQLQQAQKMEAIGTLAGGIAHDFNNILSAILGYTELGLLDKALNDQTRTRLDQIYKASQRATDLVKQILTFSRKNERDMKPVQISLIIKEALKLIRSSLPASIEIVQDVSDAPGFVLADPTQIHQIVMNLCTNAHHAMLEQGGQLRVLLRHLTATPESLPNRPTLMPGRYLQLTIADTGCGMNADTLEHIFEPYFTTKEKGKGTGLGLSVVHGIIKAHGGTVAVTSQPGQGTVFDVFFPQIDPRDEAAERPEDEVQPGRECILLVDDEEMIVEIGKNMLEHFGYQVEGQTCPLKALELFKLRANDFKLVLTDMTMPKMTGDRLARELMRIRPEVPIILSTGFNERLNQEKATALGVKALVNKPFIWREVARIIRQVLDTPAPPA